MTIFGIFMSPAVVQSLGATLLHFIWQGTALAALLAAALSVCRKSSVRYFISVITAVAMLAVPVITFLVVMDREPVRPFTSPVPSALVLANPASAPSAVSATLETAPVERFKWLVEAWLVGIVLFSFRMIAGLIAVQHLRFIQSKSLDPQLHEKCLLLQRRLGINRLIRYCKCHRIDVPSVIGWFRPVVLLPLMALTELSELQLEAVIVHELVHIRRLDAFVNLFQVMVESLLFYHPAVWWVSGRIRAEREHCCDEAVIAVVSDAVQYARALTLMEECRSAPTLAMAANRGPLFARVMRLLGIGNLGIGIRTVGVLASTLCLTGALFAGRALVALTGSLKPGTGNESSENTQASVHSRALNPQSSRVASSQTNQTGAGPSRGAERSVSVSFFEQMKAAGLDDLTSDDLVALKMEGVTPGYVRSIHELGLKPVVSQIIQMHRNAVMPEYILALREVGVDESPSQIIGMKVQGVTPEYVRSLHDLGLDAPASQLIGMRAQGISPEYVRELNDLGLHPQVNDLYGLKGQGVTADYVRDLQAAGLTLSVRDLISFRVQKIDAEYINGLKRAGLTNLSTGDYIAAKAQGITPEFVDKARNRGFRDLTISQLIGLKTNGVL
ncbi:MAG TPA: M56 family metallopeptidase [Candidatus Angelobacter sp.]